ncbi:Sulfite exporter TauE/SafE family protein 2, partial [Linum perenne]
SLFPLLPFQTAPPSPSSCSSSSPSRFSFPPSNPQPTCHHLPMTPTKLHPQSPSRQRCSSVSQHLSRGGGIGSGGLFIPILTLVAGYELRTTSTLSAFMISARSIANVICSFAVKFAGPGSGGINFDIALLLEPMMLLGVSIRVIWVAAAPSDSKVYNTLSDRIWN